MRRADVVRAAQIVGAAFALLLPLASVAAAAAPEAVSEMVEALGQGNESGAADLLAAYPDDLPEAGDAPLYARLSQLLQSETFGQLGLQGQAMLLYLHAATAPDPGERLELLKSALHPCKNTFVRPFVHYEIGRLLQAREEAEGAAAELAAAARLGAMWQQTLALRACGRLEALAQRHPEVSSVYEKVRADLARRPVEAPEGTVAGTWSLLHGQGSLEALAPRTEGEPEAVRLTARLDPQDRYTFVRMRLTLHQARWGSRLRLQLRPSIAAPIRICAIDGDSTVAGRQVEAERLAPGAWREVALDLDGTGNDGPGDYVLDEVTMVDLTLEPRTLIGTVRDWETYTLDVAGLTLSGDGALVLANAPAGDPRRRQVPTVNIPDTGDSPLWTLVGPLAVAEETEVVHSAPRSARITLPVGKAVGQVGVISPDDRVWRGDTVSFWCLAPEGSALSVLVNGVGESTVDKTFAAPELVPETWCKLTVPLEGAINVGGGDDTLDELVAITFIPETAGGDAEAGATCTWYIDDVCVTGEGPARLRPRERPQPPVASIGLEGRWFAREGLTVSDETGETRSGGHAIRLAGTLGPETNAGAVATFCAAETARRPAAGLSFWCYPRDVAFLPLILLDSAGRGAVLKLGAEDLEVGEWNHIIVPFEALDTYLGDGPLTDVSLIHWVPDAGWDPERRYITHEREYVWYLDDMELLQADPAEEQAR